MLFRSITLALFAALAVRASLAQGFDPGGPNAGLAINGQIPSIADAVDHDVLVSAPGSLVIDVTSGTNPFAGIIFLASPVDPTSGGVLPTPWGGSLDLGTAGPFGSLLNTSIVADGVGFSQNAVLDQFFRTDTSAQPRFHLVLPVNYFYAGTRTAFQAVLADPTASPFAFDNTQVADVNYLSGQTTVALTGDDGTVAVGITTPKVFHFHGSTYTDVWVVGNGYVTFGGATTTSLSGFTRNALSWLGAEPSIAACIADWAPDGNATNEGVRCEEIGTTLRIIWGDPATTIAGLPHSNDSDVNSFEIQLELDDGFGSNPNEGAFRIQHTALDPTAIVDQGDGIIGHTPGGVVSGGAQDVSLAVTQFALAGFAQVEEHDRTGDAAARLGWDGVGTPRSYNHFTRKWHGGLVEFQPNLGGLVAGDQGYTNALLTSVQDDVDGIDLATLSAAGSETVTFSGVFFGFAPGGVGTGAVTFDPNGLLGGPYPASVLGVQDSSGSQGPLSLPNPPGPNRDGESLVVLTPPLGAAGNYDVRVDFASGYTETLVVPVYSPMSQVTSYVLGDDSWVLHPLSVPVTFGGTTHSQIFVNSNGYLTFTAGASDFAAATSSLFGGWFTGAANPGVAVVYTDLNRGGLTSGATYDVVEDAATGRVQVSFTNQNHWSSTDPAGTTVCTFGTAGPYSVELDYAGFIPGIAAGDPVVIGVTDGDGVTGSDTDLTNGLGTGIFGALGSYSSLTTPDSVAETIPANTALPFTGPITFLDFTGGYLWTVF